ncbi:ABC transporter ATP-binding protein [Aeromicrobium sp.]|uniref:ABC transporter ATP-binding protein n=1 Tax=Aeromicrobium sp. TaxID=1871063 RepID=UPI002FC69783
MSGLEIAGLTKYFGDLLVLDDVSIDVEAGAILAVLGPSGGGKTTLLRIIAGFLDPDAGSVSFGGRTLVRDGRGVPPQRRGVGYVPQEGALFPHLDVAANIAFGIRGAARRGFDVNTMLALVDLPAALRSRFPHELSGGQQQRVALARALAPRPDIVLLDEPFSSLDAGLRLETGQAVAHALRAAGATAVLVTHDQGEALALADQVAVLQGGRVAQVASPADLYRSPATPAVAAFVGAVVTLDADVSGDLASCALGKVTVPAGGPQGACRLMIRPEHLVLSPDPADGAPARVVHVSFFGHDATVELVLIDQELTLQVRVPGAAVPEIDDLLSVSIGGPVAVVAGAR